MINLVYNIDVPIYLFHKTPIKHLTNIVTDPQAECSLLLLINI